MSKKEISVYTAGSAFDLGNIGSNYRLALPKIKGIRWLHPALAPANKGFSFAYPRDIIQLQESDVILAVFTKGRVQRGTSAEVGMASIMDKVIIIVSEDEECDHELRYILAFIHTKVRTLKEALEVLEFMGKGFI